MKEQKPVPQPVEPWPFPPPDFKHPKPGDRVPLGLDDYEDALL